MDLNKPSEVQELMSYGIRSFSRVFWDEENALVTQAVAAPPLSVSRRMLVGRRMRVEMACDSSRVARIYEHIK